MLHPNVMGGRWFRWVHCYRSPSPIPGARGRDSHMSKSHRIWTRVIILPTTHNALFYMGNPWKFTTPRCSMYGIFADISPKFMVNVCIYSIHGAYGLHLHCLIPPKTANLISPVEVENSHLWSFVYSSLQVYRSPSQSLTAGAHENGGSQKE